MNIKYFQDTDSSTSSSAGARSAKRATSMRTLARWGCCQIVAMTIERARTCRYSAVFVRDCGLIMSGHGIAGVFVW